MDFFGDQTARSDSNLVQPYLAEMLNIDLKCYINSRNTFESHGEQLCTFFETKEIFFAFFFTFEFHRTDMGTNMAAILLLR